MCKYSGVGVPGKQGYFAAEVQWLQIKIAMNIIILGSEGLD